MGPESLPASRFSNSGASSASQSTRSGRAGRDPATVTPATTPLSLIMCSMRSIGYPGSMGTKAAPVSATAHMASTDSAERGIEIATARSGPAPAAISTRASRLAYSVTSL
ncbi:hypothetical protein NS07_v2contig00127-0011 [Nocardia seriolae]|nr:hypothetical protein NSER024013_21740 [Nocardia seriolae]GAM49895.1 hypothetical protein NS07_v2contig00127-0011 [Nocardia seriolae]GEM27554.1 hypothetical protein NS2_57930 [Nocardia seriolae NBRC 15557]